MAAKRWVRRARAGATGSYRAGAGPTKREEKLRDSAPPTACLSLSPLARLSLASLAPLSVARLRHHNRPGRREHKAQVNSTSSS